MNTNHSPAAKRILEILLAILIIALLFVLAFFLTPALEGAPSQGTPTVSTGASPVSVEANRYPYQGVRLAWFYKPPEEHLLPVVAQNFDVFILTHKDEAERDTLKSLGVKAPILLYLQLLEIKDPGSCTARPQGNQVAYRAGDFCQQRSSRFGDADLDDPSAARDFEGAEEAELDLAVRAHRFSLTPSCGAYCRP